MSDREAAMRYFATETPDLVLLDISLGHELEAGFEICRELRKQSDTLPIVFLTSHVSDFDKISGMRLGADDYLTKDINLDYLIVRIRALLNRVNSLRNHATDNTPNEVTRGDLKINLDQLSITWKSQRVELSLTQFWMVHSLVSHPGHVRSHAQLMEAASITVEPNTIAAHIKSIRDGFQKIDPDFRCIQTERGIGYRWRME
jgi:two-component system OmpR family response regulator